jgi:CubicO group peptidase (beta-lactamase class C family)
VTGADEIDQAAANGFSGVVSISRAGAVEFEKAYGLADRAHQVPATVETQFGIASGTKGFTALVVMSLIEDGLLDLATRVRPVLGADLPLIDDSVTVEHLLAHTSGIGDYVDESADAELEDYLLRVPVHTLDATEGYVAALDGFPQKFAPGERFEYCNSGYVVLALVTERVAGRPFAELVAERVTGPAGMTLTEFLRSDRLPGSAALGYLPDGRTNVLHLPVRGSGDGGAYSTAADIRAFWTALFAGRIVPAGRAAEMTRRHARTDRETICYGLGFWLPVDGPQVLLTGGDVGVSFWSVHDPTTGLTYTVLSNTAEGAGPMKRRLDALLR